MIYSVWNQARGVYDYYQAPGAQATVNAPKPKHLRSRQLGVTPEQAAWPLPQGAKKVGSGEAARGRVASTTSGTAMGFFGVETLFDIRFVALGIAAFVVYRARKKGVL